MAEEKEDSPRKAMNDLKKEVKEKDKKSKMDIIKQVATRDKLERDYTEDLLKVQFHSSPETERMVEAKRPTQEEMMTIMRLSAEASIYEGKMDKESIDRMINIYDELPKIAGKLCVDKSLDEKFWKNSVSFNTLQNFITELIRITQMGPMGSDEMESFR